MDGSTVSALCRFTGKRSGAFHVWPVRMPVRFRFVCGKYSGRRNAFDAADAWRYVRIGVWGLGLFLTEKISPFNIVS